MDSSLLLCVKETSTRQIVSRRLQYESDLPRQRSEIKKMQYADIIKRLESLSNPLAVEGMAKYGITPEKAYGVWTPNLRKIAREIGKDHDLAQQLWEAGIRETRALASMIDDPKLVTEDQMGSWVKDFDSWDVCDGCCQDLFGRTKFAYQKAIEWSSSDKEFIKTLNEISYEKP